MSCIDDDFLEASQQPFPEICFECADSFDHLLLVKALQPAHLQGELLRYALELLCEGNEVSFTSFHVASVYKI